MFSTKPATVNNSVLKLIEGGDLSNLTQYIVSLNAEQLNEVYSGRGLVDVVTSICSNSVTLLLDGDRHSSSAGYIGNQAPNVHLPKDVNRQVTVVIKGTFAFIENAKKALAEKPLPENVECQFNVSLVLPALKLLLQAGAKGNWADSLIVAITEFDDELFDLILNESPDITKAFEKAVAVNNLTAASKLLSKNKLSQLCIEQALHFVNSAEMVRLLHQHDANVNAPRQFSSTYLGRNDYKGDSPLHSAVRNCRSEVVTELLKLGANPVLVNDKNETVLHAAIKSLQMMKLAGGFVDVNAPDIYGNTAMHEVVKDTNDDSETKVKYLLDQNARCDIPNRSRLTAFALLVGSAIDLQDETLDLFLSRSVINGVINDRGQTALHCAASDTGPQSLRISEKLLALGAEHEGRDESGKTVLMLLLTDKFRFCSAEDLTPAERKLLNDLIAKTTDLNWTDKSGNTVLHYLCAHGLVEEARVVVERGAMVNCVNHEGHTPLSFAVAEGYPQMVKVLKGQDVESLRLFRGAEQNDKLPTYTQQVGAQLCRLYPETDVDKQCAIKLCMNAVQFARWTLQSPQREQVFASYKDTIDYLIQTYGRDNFIAACQDMFDNHRDSLDIRNTEEYGAHTDIAPYGACYMRSARHLLADKYFIEHDMRNFGHLVNIKTLFGDTDFWSITREHHKEVYDALIQHLKEWPVYVDFKAIYCKGRQACMFLFKKHFAEAFDFIHQDLGLLCDDSLSDHEDTSSFFSTRRRPFPNSADPFFHRQVSQYWK